MLAFTFPAIQIWALIYPPRKRTNACLWGQKRGVLVRVTCIGSRFAYVLRHADWAQQKNAKKKLLKRLHALRAYTREFTLLRVKKLAVKQKPVRYGESSMAMRFFSCTVITSASPVACCMACERGRVSSFASLNWGDSLTVQQWISGCCLRTYRSGVRRMPRTHPAGILLTPLRYVRRLTGLTAAVR